MDRDEIIRQLSVALPIYKEMEEYDKRIKEREKKQNNNRSDKALTIFLAWIISAFVLACIFIGISVRILSNDNYRYLMTPTMILVIVILVIVIATIITIPVGLSLKKSEKKEQDKINQLLDERTQFVQNRFCPELLILPPDYRYAFACEYILSCFKNMRADTMKEAVNLYVEQLDRWKQENLLKNMQSQMAQIQREQASSNAFFETAVFIGLMSE